jgi:hypothetical protein
MSGVMLGRDQVFEDFLKARCPREANASSHRNASALTSQSSQPLVRFNETRIKTVRLLSTQS